MQFASGIGQGAYIAGSSANGYTGYGNTYNFFNVNAPSTTLTVGSGIFPQRIFKQGNVVPGMFLNYTSGTKGPQWIYSTSCRFALGSSTGGNDIGAITINLNPEPGWAGTASVQLQGSFKRFAANSTAWINIGSPTNVTTADVDVILQITADNMLPSYRLQATLTSSSSGDGGVIDWAVANMFVDLSAEKMAANADYVNGRLGQPTLVTNSTIPFGRETSWVGNTGNTGVNQTEIEPMFTPGGMM
jgi:hypothetical protein